ncbi:MAG: hypothetical protein ACYDEX_13890 [Mobilitalea sp.]
MPRMKMLKSIAHNAAHSYLSLMNYINGEYTVDRLFQVAKESRETNIVIDILQQSIEPSIYLTTEIKLSLIYLKNSLESLLSSEKIPLDNILSAKIRINFNLEEETKLSSNVQGLELPKYKCESEIIDINGKVYKKEVIEWWKY